MKKFVVGIAMALVLFVANTTAFAAVKSENVTLSNDTVINGTVIKKGSYKVTFDDQTNEVIFWNGKEAMVKTTAKVENRASKASRFTLNHTVNGSERVLTSFSFSNDDKTIVLDSGKKAVTLPPTSPLTFEQALSALK